MNAAEVLENVEKYIELGKTYNIDDVYDKLGIFDWWNNTLSQTQLKDMRKFLKESIKLGFTGYVCFKVGAAGCANGMWSHKKESTTGFSPDGAILYKSFVSSYNYWQFSNDGKTFYPDDSDDNNKFDSLKTIKQLEEKFKEING